MPDSLPTCVKLERGIARGREEEERGGKREYMDFWKEINRAAWKSTFPLPVLASRDSTSPVSLHEGAAALGLQFNG